jgi:hypothetical protein
MMVVALLSVALFWWSIIDRKEVQRSGVFLYIFSYQKY